MGTTKKIKLKMKSAAFYLAFATTKSLPIPLPSSIDIETASINLLSFPASTISNQLSTQTCTDVDQLFKNTENLKILDSHNFNRKVLENDGQDWMIMFYLPNCQRSKLLAPKFQEAAFLARNSGIKFGVVDAWNEYWLLDDNGIELNRYPSVKFFDHESQSFRDYPETLHGYYTSSEDFKRVAITLRDNKPEIEAESSGASGPTGISGPIGIFSKHKNDYDENSSSTDFPEFIQL